MTTSAFFELLVDVCAQADNHAKIDFCATGTCESEWMDGLDLTAVPVNQLDALKAIYDHYRALYTANLNQQK